MQDEKLLTKKKGLFKNFTSKLDNIAQKKGAKVYINAIHKMWDWAKEYDEIKRVTNFSLEKPELNLFDNPTDVKQELNHITKELLTHNKVGDYVATNGIIDSLIPFARLFNRKIQEHYT